MVEPNQVQKAEKLLMFYKCPMPKCQVVFLSMPERSLHLNKAHGLVEKCGFASCPEAFSTKLELWDHLRERHGWQGQKGLGNPS